MKMMKKTCSIRMFRQMKNLKPVWRNFWKARIRT